MGRGPVDAPIHLPGHGGLALPAGRGQPVISQRNHASSTATITHGRSTSGQGQPVRQGRADGSPTKQNQARGPAPALYGLPVQTWPEPPFLRKSLLRGLLRSDSHVVAKLTQPLDVVAGDSLGVLGIEVVDTEIGVRTSSSEQVLCDHQDGVANGDDGLLAAASFGEALKLGSEVRVASTSCGPGDLSEHRP